MPHFPRHRTRIVAAATISLVTVVALAGCGRAEPADNVPAARAGQISDGPAEGVVTAWAPEGDATKLLEILDPFFEQNPDVDVELTLVPADEYTTKLQTAVSAGSTPDLAFLYTESQVAFTSSGAFAPIPIDLVDEDVFFKGVWDAGTYDGVSYSVPWYAYTRALIYRSDFADAAGAEAPTTWEEWLPFLRKIQEGGAEVAFSGDIGWDVYTGQTWGTHAMQAGSGIITADGTGWDLDSPEGVAAAEYFVAPFAEGLASLDAPGFLDSHPYLYEGRTGAMISGPFSLGRIDAIAGNDVWKDEHLRTAMLPAGPHGVVGQLAGGSWGVLEDAANSDAAWKVARFLAAPETQIAQYQSHGSMPAVVAAWEDPVIADQPLLDAFFEQMNTAEAMPGVPSIAEVLTVIGNQMESVARGTSSARDAMAAAQAQADAIGLGE
jgi:multiple sugar transport system substrate-binding protein